MKIMKHNTAKLYKNEPDFECFLKDLLLMIKQDLIEGNDEHLKTLLINSKIKHLLEYIGTEER